MKCCCHGITERKELILFLSHCLASWGINKASVFWYIHDQNCSCTSQILVAIFCFRNINPHHVSSWYIYILGETPGRLGPLSIFTRLSIFFSFFFSLTSMILYRNQHSRIKLTTVKFSYKLSYLLRKLSILTFMQAQIKHSCIAESYEHCYPTMAGYASSFQGKSS
jgi:hypothetical protein